MGDDPLTVAMVTLKKFLAKLGVEPKDLSIYRRAFTHLSAAENPLESYERLEFLGDAVIGSAISEYLYNKFPDKGEGDLSRIRAMVVNKDTLGAKALDLGLDKVLRADTVRVREGEQAEFSILADSFEAFVGAVYADRGYRLAKKIVIEHLGPLCLELWDISGPSDYKSRLQELWQQRTKETPEYRVVSESGPDHDKVFSMEVFYGRKVLGRGEGPSKKKAEQEAAKDAWEREACQKKTRRSGKSR